MRFLVFLKKMSYIIKKFNSLKLIHFSKKPHFIEILTSTAHIFTHYDLKREIVASLTLFIKIH